MSETKTYIRFERGRDDVVGPTFGPFDWVQITYTALRVGPDGEDLAYWDHEAGEWFIASKEDTHHDEFYSDYIIYHGTKPEDVGTHNCAAGRVTTEGDGITETRWDEVTLKWVKTDRTWDSEKGIWKKS